MTDATRRLASARPLLCILSLLLLAWGGTGLAIGQVPDEGPDIYWVFVDGGPRTGEGLTAAAVERRRLRGAAGVAHGDAGVQPEQLVALAEAGARPRVVSRLLQAVSVSATPEVVGRLEALPFVRAVRPVAQLRGTAAVQRAERGASPLLARGTAAYGPSYEQLAVINAVQPLERGIDGRGVTLGFLDCPYGDFDHPVFDPLLAASRLVAVRDFTGRSQNCWHGLSVASVAVGHADGQLVGPAHGAHVLAAVTEYAPTETRTEEEDFVAGLEWLEANGADVVNISLGYTTFDAGEGSYSPRDLTGDVGVTTRAVDAAASRGMVVVTSAGNSGCFAGPTACWHYIGMPADADSAIAVGAIAIDSTLASFSSRGPTADGRIKPDVVAPGVSVYVAEPTGYRYANGTSFSSPLVAGVVAQILQVNPTLSPIDVRDILRQTASQSTDPDTLMGWGVVDAAAAVAQAEQQVAVAPSAGVPDGMTLSAAFPNPFRQRAHLTLQVRRGQHIRAVLLDVLGRERAVLHDGYVAGASSISLVVEGHGLAGGTYLIRVTGDEASAVRRVVRVR